MTYLNELKRIIELGQLDIESPYYDLYEYICESQRDLKILFIIDEIIINRIEYRKNNIIEELKDQPIINYDSFPVIGNIIKKILLNDCIEYQTIEELEKEENIRELEIKIYSQILQEIDGIEKRFKKNTYIESREKRITYLKEKIINKCMNVLQNVKLKGKSLVENGEIKNNLFNELYQELDETTLKKLHELTEIEKNKTNIYYKLKIVFDILENLNNIFDELLLEILKEKLKELDKKILSQLNDKKYKKEKQALIKNNHLENEEICLGTFIPQYIEKFDIEIFKILNERSRLLKIYNRIAEKPKQNIEALKLLSSQEQEILKESLKKEIDVVTLENKDAKDAINILKETLKNFKKQKEAELINLHGELINQKNSQATIETTKTKNLQALYVPSCSAEMTPLEAIYVYNAIININKSGSDLNLYRQLIEFISEIRIINPEVENVIRQIINEQFGIYFNEIKERIINGKINIETVQKKIRYGGK